MSRDRRTDNPLEKNIDDRTAALLDRWKQKAREVRRERVREHVSIKREIARRWKKPLELMDILLDVSAEAGERFSQEYAPIAEKENNLVFIVVRNMHIRSCRVAAEIRELMSSGFADGAMARWRTLNEISVICLFIRGHGIEAAKRYIDHEVIVSFNLIDEYLKAIPDGGEFKKEDLDRATQLKDRMVEKYEKIFEKDYGWAAPWFNEGEVPTFKKIEDSQLKQLRPYYRFASQEVHAGVKGDRYQMGLHPKQQGTALLAGPSVWGLEEPGQNTAISVHQILASFLTIRLNLESFAFLRAHQSLERETVDAFVGVGADMRSRALASDNAP
jgi:hypothetical protein